MLSPDASGRMRSFFTQTGLEPAPGVEVRTFGTLGTNTSCTCQCLPLLGSPNPEPQTLNPKPQTLNPKTSQQQNGEGHGREEVIAGSHDVVHLKSPKP